MSNRSTHLAHPPGHADAAPAPAHSGKAITMLKVHPYEGAGLVVTSDAVDLDGRLDARFSQAGENMSPPLAWTAIAQAVAYALVVEDPDAPREDPVAHWLLWDIPGDATALPAGVANDAHPATLPGAVQGRNDHGEFGWMGPQPPPGHGPHRYHFQLFALGKRLEMGPETTLLQLTDALKGATVAAGELVATFETSEDDPANTDVAGTVGVGVR